MEQDLQDWDIGSGVGITALIVAAARAVETKRADGLISDPLAEAFVRAADKPIPFPTRLSDFTDYSPELDQRLNNVATAIGVRSKFFDEYFADACTADPRQAVLLGAGLDTRAFRLIWPAGFTVYEIDQPKVLSFKDRVVEEQRARPQCSRRVVTVDLRENWAGSLLEAGFDTKEPTVWLAEGLVPYLPPTNQLKLLDTIRHLSMPGSYLALDHIESARTSLDPAGEGPVHWGFDISEANAMEQEINAIRRGDGPIRAVDPSGYLADQGWKVTSLTLTKAIERYRRRLKWPTADLQYANNFYYLHIAHLPRAVTST